MIFERRAYTLRPGRLDAFWKAQETWNRPEIFGPVLKRNLGYFSAWSGTVDEVVHLYRFDSLDLWDARYKDYYQAQSPDYFALVRPWMLRQENGFLAPPPHAGLAARWTGERPELPPALIGGQPGDVEDICVTETIVSFFPGGLPAYWRACEAHRLASDPVSENLLAELVSLSGRLHRVLRYEAFANVSEARRRSLARDQDENWRAFEASFSEWVAERNLTFLRPSPLASRRAWLGEGAA